MAIWKCNHCGNTLDVVSPPEICPSCKKNVSLWMYPAISRTVEGQARAGLIPRFSKKVTRPKSGPEAGLCAPRGGGDNLNRIRWGSVDSFSDGLFGITCLLGWDKGGSNWREICLKKALSCSGTRKPMLSPHIYPGG